MIRKLILLLSVACSAAVSGQTTDYVYGIQFGQGGGSVSDTWNLDELAVSVNGSGTPTSYADTSLVNLTTIIPGWDSSGATRQNQSLNGLALDPATKTLFLTYSYNNNVSSTAGAFTATVYAVRYNAGAFNATQIYNYSQAAGSAGTAGVIGSGGDPGSPEVASGWFTKGAFYNGSYYAGIQSSTDNMVQLTLGPGENSVITATVYTKINHGGASADNGGDFVISGGNIYVSGRIAGTSGSSLATTTLANATNPSGSAWNVITDSATGQYYYQLAGLGELTHLYGFASGAGSPTFGELTNYDDPSGSAPVFTTISGTSPVIFADLSDGSSSSMILPEPANVVAGIFGGIIALFEFVRRIRSKTAKR